MPPAMFAFYLLIAMALSAEHQSEALWTGACLLVVILLRRR